MTAWRTSSYCNNGQCARVAIEPGRVLMSDSKDPDGPVPVFTPDEWRDFVGGVKDGDFDFTVPASPVSEVPAGTPASPLRT